jgi:hypothetical protein
MLESKGVSDIFLAKRNNIKGSKIKITWEKTEEKKKKGKIKHYSTIF